MYKNKVIICGVDTSKLPLLKEAQKEALLKKSARLCWITPTAIRRRARSL